MPSKYLDLSGLSYLWEKIKAKITSLLPSKTSDLTNDSGFITKSVNDLANYYLKSETYKKTEVNNLIAAIKQFHYEIAASTSAVNNPQSNVLYLIGPVGSGSDKYEEYVYPNSTTGWVKIGDTSIDLSGYVTTSALNTALAAYTTTSDLTTLLAGKLDAPATAGTSGQVLTSDGQGGQSWQTPQSGVSSYNDLNNKPQINSVTLSGNKSASDLGLATSAQGAKADTAIQPAEFNELEEEVGTIGNGAYEESWDGSSAPVVADIPAGVSVTYNSASYTGTLAASASTVDKIYLVSDGNGNYDRYTTVEANGAYSWKKVGSTAIPLSNYATKTEVSQLEAEQYGYYELIWSQLGAAAFWGEKPDIDFSGNSVLVSLSLENCTSSNNSLTTRRGEAYSATISPNPGCILGEVKCWMSGNEISVVGGVISIAEVTGPIAISASVIGLDNVAYENLTYRQIFETNNLLGISPGFEDGSFSPLVHNDTAPATPTITTEDVDSGSYSMKCFDSQSANVKIPNYMTRFSLLLAVRVKVVSYSAGSIGILSNVTCGCDSVTNGWVTKTALKPTSSNIKNSVIVGSFSSASLDGYVDTPVVVNPDIFSTTPTLTAFTELYDNYVLMKKSE